MSLSIERLGNRRAVSRRIDRPVQPTIPTRKRRSAGESPPAAGGDVESRNRLVQENLGLVYRVARPFINRGLTLEDLVGEGNLGLIRAAQHYDPGLGTRFSTYATYWIREAIQAAVANTAGTIRLPANVCRLLGRWRRAEWRLRQARGYPPTFEEIAGALGLDLPTQRLVAQARRAARLQRDAFDFANWPSTSPMLLDESMSAEETLNDHEERESIFRRLESLEGAERMVLSLRYGLSGEPPLSLDQIGGRLGMTRTAVQKTMMAAIRKLGRHPLAQHPARPSDRQEAGCLKVG